MRLSSRAAGLLALAVVAITCTDASTGPGVHRPGFTGARLMLAPSFSPGAERAYSALEAMGIGVTQVRIRLRAADGTVARDTTVQFGANDTLRLQIQVEIQGTEQTFSALIELLDASGLVLFSQTQDVVARASTLPAAPPPTITLEYVGPGASARSLTVTPGDLTVPPGVEPVLTAVGTDAGGAPVTDLLLAWTSSDATLATVSAVGRVATVRGTGRRGAVTITATTPTGLTGTARLAMLPLATRLIVVSGDAQVSIAGRALALPMVVELQGVDGGPIPNATVTFRAVSAGATVGAASATTDAAGRASTTLTLGRTAGTYAFEAASGAVPPVTISATAAPAPAVALAVTSGDAQSSAVGLPLALPLVVRARDEFGGVVRNAAVAWNRVAGLGSLGAASTMTDSLGFARVTYTLGGTPSVDSIRASLPGASPTADVLFTVRALAGAAAKLLFVARAPDTITVGMPFAPVSVRLADALGNAVRAAGVVVRVRGTGVAPDSAAYRDSTVTDTAGVATFVIPPYRGLVGQVQLTFASAGLDTASQAIVAAAGAPAGLLLVQQPSASAVSGAIIAQPAVVQLADVGRNPVAGVVPVTASLLGGGTLGGTTVMNTDAAGRVAFGALSIVGAAGSYVLQFASGSLASATSAPIALGAGVAANLAAVGGTGGGVVGGVVVLTARVTDAAGNPVPGHIVTWAVTGGSGSLPVATTATDARGETKITWTLGFEVGTQTVAATAAGLAGSPALFTVTATAPANAQLRLATQPGAPGFQAPSGVALTPQPVVQLTDSTGAILRQAGVAVSATLSGTGATLRGNLTSVTDSSGRATFSGLDILGIAGSSQSIVFSASGFTGVTSAPLLIGPGVAARIAPAAGDGQTALAGAPTGIAPSVVVKDSSGNPVANVVVSFAITGGGGSLTQAADTTDVAGLASPGLWTLGIAIGGNTLAATASGLDGSPVNFTATAVATDSGTTTVAPGLDTLTSLTDTRQLTAQKRNAASTVVAGTWIWESRAPAVATVAPDGLVTAVTNGTTWIVAMETAGSRDSARIVVEQRAASVSVTPSTRSLYTTGLFTYAALAVDGRGFAMQTQPAFTWTSTQPSVATIDPTSGVATAVAIGSTQIRAASGATVGVSSLTVLSPITRIDVTYDSVGALAPDVFTMTSLGAQRSYRAIARDTLLNPMTGATFVWSSTNSSVALVDSAAPTTARVTAAANGVTSIRASAQGVTGGATLTVAQQLASIELTPATTDVSVGGQASVLARGKDALGRYITGGAFAYTSALPTVATVNAVTGVVTGVSLGTTTVTAASGAVTSNAATVTVSGTGPSVISFGRDTIGIGRGSTLSVPIYLSRPSALAPVVVTLAVSDTLASWSAATLTIPAGQTTANATLTGRAAGTTRVIALDGGLVYAGDTAVLAVQATLRLAASSYSLTATDQLNTQVVLSDPSPAGGTFVTFGYGTAGIASLSPDPAFIPAGQLAADVVILGLTAGTATVTPTAAGVNGTASSVSVSAAALSLPYTAIRLGAGQYDPNQYVQLPTYPYAPLAVTLASTDTSVATVPPAVTIPTTTYYSYFPVTARARGTALVVASAPGWSPDTLSVLSTTPMVTICCGGALNSTAPATSVTVYSADSLRSVHPRAGSLAVRLSSSDPAVMQVLDTLVTIGAGAYYTSAARIVPGGTGGTAWIVATASGHVADSTFYTVTGPQLSLSYATSLLGAGQEDQSPYVSIPNAIATPLVVSLSGSDSAVVGTGESVIIPAGSYYAYFTARGKAVGTSTLVASAAGYGADTAVTTVTTPTLRVGGASTLNAYATGSANVYSADSTGNVHVRSTPLVVSFRSSDPSVLTVDTTATIASGTYYAAIAPVVTAVGPGTARIIVTAPGHASDSAIWTVQPARLSLNWNDYIIGARQHRAANDFYVQTPSIRAVPVAVTLTSSQPGTVALTTSLATIPANSYYQYFSFAGLVPGRDTIVASAPGYLPDTAYVTVTSPALRASGLPATGTTTDPPRNVTLYAADSLGGTHYASDTVVVRAVSSDTTVLRPGEAYVRIARDGYFATATVQLVGAGTASITYSDSAGGGYGAATTNAITVTGPSLAIAGANPGTLGMRQQTYDGAYYVYAPNPVGTPLTVTLASTGTRVATVPASVTIPAGSYYAYFTITAQDTVGTIQIQASATGYTAAAVNLQVTAPRFVVYTSPTLNTTSPTAMITVQSADAAGGVHPVSEDVTVTLASSSAGVASIDSLSITIPAGQFYSSAARWTPGSPGSAQLSASDARSAFYAYGTGTVSVNVVTPAASLSFGTLALGLGQYSDEYVSLPEYVTTALTVPIDHAAVARTTTPSSVTIPASGSYQYFRIAGASEGRDTITVRPAGHLPASGSVNVGLGRIDPLSGWPTSLRVGDSVQVTLYARDPQQGTRYVTAATSFSLAPNANVEFVSGGATSTVMTTVTVPADNQYVQFWLKGVAVGTGSATITNATYSPYTNSLTVTSP